VAQHDPPVFPSLRLTSVDAGDPRLVHTDDPVHEIEVRQNKRNLFGRPHSGEESELIIVALSLAPVATDCGNQCFRILHTKRVDTRPILFLEARASKTSGGVVLLGMISIAKIERATKDADGIVECFLAPGFAIRNGDKPGVTHMLEETLSEHGTPHSVQHSSIGTDRRCSKVVTK
jgi:hypothetical protein